LAQRGVAPLARAGAGVVELRQDLAHEELTEHQVLVAERTPPAGEDASVDELAVELEREERSRRHLVEHWPVERRAAPAAKAVVIEVEDVSTRRQAVAGDEAAAGELRADESHGRGETVLRRQRPVQADEVRGGGLSLAPGERRVLDAEHGRHPFEQS